MNNIFISQSKGKSRDLAAALQEWLIDDMEIGTPWMSEDIPGGDNWRDAIEAALNQARIGIICITSENKNNQWIIFEAGALFINGIKIFPYVLDLDTMKELPSPIRDLQGKKADKEGTKELVKAINKALGNPLHEETLIRKFNRVWSKLEEKINEITKKKTPADYEKLLQDFQKLTIYVNRYRDTFRRSGALDFSSNVEDVIESLSGGNYDREQTVRHIYEIIETERKRERYNTGNTLVPNILEFLREHFNIEHLRRIIIRLESILFSESPIEKKPDELKLQITRESSKVYLRYQQQLVKLLRRNILGEPRNEDEDEDED